MPASATTPAAQSRAKRGALTGAALSDEVLDSSRSVLRPIRGAKAAVTGLQQVSWSNEPEQPISREELLRELRKQGVEASGEEIAEEDIRVAWEATAMLASAASVKRPSWGNGACGNSPDWHRVPVEEPEQLDLFAVAG